MKKLLLTLLAIVSTLHAQKQDAQPDAKQIAEMQRVIKTIGEIEYTAGEIPLIGGKAKIKLTEDFRYLDPANARKVLVDIWSNPPDAGSTMGIFWTATHGSQSSSGRTTATSKTRSLPPLISTRCSRN